jgi:hypothetical protein
MSEHLCHEFLLHSQKQWEDSSNDITYSSQEIGKVNSTLIQATTSL